jgi:hemolysin activation/secretion protein
LDIRSFYTLFGKTVLAAQLYNYSTFGKTLLRDQATVGGAGNMRGIYDGRFRDNNATSLIVEYRVPLFWRFCICTFSNIGNVYKKAKDLRSPMKYSFGEGLRIALLKKDKLNLRLDYGYYSKKSRHLSKCWRMFLEKKITKKQNFQVTSQTIFCLLLILRPEPLK